STSPVSDVVSEPLHRHVSVYHSGRSDGLFVDLFVIGRVDLNYPAPVPYDGPLFSTSPLSEVDDQSLRRCVSVYHSGRSDEPLTEVGIPSEMPVDDVAAEGKVAVASKLCGGLFRKNDLFLDYPAMKAYEGSVDAMFLMPDVDSEPIEDHVTVYHSGRSDELELIEKRSVVDVGDVDAAKAFKAGVSVGVAPVHLVSDVVGEPLQDHVSVYHSGRSDAPFSDLYKIGRVDLDYPAPVPYDGPVFSMRPVSDLKDEPLRKYVSVYHSGRSDEPTASLLKMRHAHLGYPLAGFYDAPVTATSPISDVDEKPLREHVSVYHSGRSDESVARRLKTPARPEYPAYGPYYGPLASTCLASDLDEVSLKEHVSAYPSGHSDEPVTSLLKRRRAHLDYPLSGPYDGPLALTSVASEVDEEPLLDHVALYHSGRSDEKAIGPFKRDLRVLSGRNDYPISDVYVGPLSYLTFSPDIEYLPLHEVVDVYHIGSSELQLGQLPFNISVREDEIPYAKVEARHYPLRKDDGSRDHVLKPLVSSSAYAYSGSEYRRYREVEPPTLRSESEQKTTDFDASVSGGRDTGRPLPIGIAHPVPKVPPVPPTLRFHEIPPIPKIPEIPPIPKIPDIPRIPRIPDIPSIPKIPPIPKIPEIPPIPKIPEIPPMSSAPEMPRIERYEKVSETMSTPLDFAYHRKTREVDYWIERRSERQSKPSRDLTADIGIDLASDTNWDEHHLSGTYPRSTYEVRSDKITARKVSPTSNLHWTTVSETTSVSYKKRISIERRRSHQTLPPHFSTYRRQYRPSTPAPEVSAYARHDKGIFESSTLPRTYAGVAIEGGLRAQRARCETSSLPTTYYSKTETRRNLVRYDLPRPSSPPRYEYWLGERNKWTVEGSPRQLSSVTDQNGRSVHDDRYVRRTKQEALHYQKSNLEEIPIVSLIKDLPMIEDGAIECSCSTVLPAPKIETQDLTPGEHSRPSRSAPLRRARQRIRNLCTML
ncbi:unnamed protein product, partial [Litomosoides sigmodontis]